MNTLPSYDVLPLVTRLLTAGGPDAIGEALERVADALGECSLVLRAADESRTVLASAGDAGGPFRLDLPLRSGVTVVGTLTASGAYALTAPAVALLHAVTDACALTLHLQMALAAAHDALLDAEAERGELAHELHDGLAQTLVAARHAISVNAAPTTTSAVLARAVREGRRAVALLRPRAVDGDLARALRGLASDLTATGSPVTLDTSTLPMLPPATATLAYRVVTAVMREEIGAIRVQVRLEAAERVFVTVSGVVDALDASVIARWRRRVRVAGGSLSIDADRVFLELPVPADAAHAASATIATLGARR